MAEQPTRLRVVSPGTNHDGLSGTEVGTFHLPYGTDGRLIEFVVVDTEDLVPLGDEDMFGNPERVIIVSREDVAPILPGRTDRPTGRTEDVMSRKIPKLAGLRAYYTMLARDFQTDPWRIEFGDYDRDVVEQEAEDTDFETKIIRTDSDYQGEIDAAVTKLNTPITETVVLCSGCRGVITEPKEGQTNCGHSDCAS